MKHPKTLKFALFPAMAAFAALPASAQVRMELTSQKEYRQDKKSVKFTGGRFNINFSDGSVASIAGCNWIQYYPPGYFQGVCSEGTTGLLTTGTLDGANPQFPYLLVTSVFPAVVVEPRLPNLVTLIAAPASKLPRPAGGFSDNSLSLFYNLHTGDNVREYVLTRYNTARTYNAKQRSKFESEIVTGVYHYKFPRLNSPQLFSAIKAVIYPMPEGLAKKNNRLDGFGFTQVNGSKLKWNKGFVEISARRPNIVNWRKLSPSAVFPAVDSMFVSLREMTTPGDPKSGVAPRTRSIFPQFVTGADARLKLASPFADSFTFPPVLESGTTAILEVELERNFQTGGVTFDFSSRRFQMPIIVLDRYTEYAKIVFGKTVDILKDTDGDGYNNLTEWILESNANEVTSVPVAPVPTLVQGIVDPIFGPLGDPYYGFTIRKKLGTIPAVAYELQRSIDNGATWEEFVSDDNWLVEDLTYTERGMVRSEIKVSSLWTIPSGNILIPDTPVQPPGTESHIYRVKVTRR
jgi:hypothetical protein